MSTTVRTDVQDLAPGDVIVYRTTSKVTRYRVEEVEPEDVSGTLRIHLRVVGANGRYGAAKVFRTSGVSRFEVE